MLVKQDIISCWDTCTHTSLDLDSAFALSSSLLFKGKCKSSQITKALCKKTSRLQPHTCPTYQLVQYCLERKSHLLKRCGGRNIGIKTVVLMCPFTTCCISSHFKTTLNWRRDVKGICVNGNGSTRMEWEKPNTSIFFRFGLVPATVQSSLVLALTIIHNPGRITQTLSKRRLQQQQWKKKAERNPKATWWWPLDAHAPTCM